MLPLNIYAPVHLVVSHCTTYNFIARQTDFTLRTHCIGCTCSFVLLLVSAHVRTRGAGSWVTPPTHLTLACTPMHSQCVRLVVTQWCTPVPCIAVVWGSYCRCGLHEKLCVVVWCGKLESVSRKELQAWLNDGHCNVCEHFSLYRGKYYCYCTAAPISFLLLGEPHFYFPYTG